MLIDSVHDYAIYMLDPNGIVVSWNSGAQRFKGYTASEIIGKPYSLFFTEEDRAEGRPRRALEIARAEGRYETEGWRVRKDGTRFWVNAIIDPIRDEAGSLVGFAKVTRDITERRMAQEALRQSEERFRLLVQGVMDYAIFMLDPAGYITNWNTGARRMKGYDADEIVGQHFSRFYSEEDLAAGLPARALGVAKQEGRFEMEGWRVRKDGTRFWANVVIDAILNDGGDLVGFAKITRDITERRQMQTALEDARTALFQAQKMEALGQLTGGIAHDFNNLMQVIGGSLEVIELRLASGRSDVHQHLSATRTAVSRAAAMTQRLLAFARRQPLRPDGTDLCALVGGMQALIERSVGEGIRVETILPGGAWAALVDANQLESALLNLAINARDAMPEGGRLSIEVSNAHLEEVPANTAFNVKPGDYVRLTVTDTGTGMPPDVLERAYEPFFTTKPIGQGTGLGLSQLYGFVQQSGGCVRIDSAVGQGTSVTIYLPRHHGEVARPTDAPMPRPPSVNDRRTILVIEDEALVRMLLVESLAEQGYAVLEAEDGDAALRALEDADDIDLLVTDVGLPGINGRQIAEIARERCPRLKVLFMTGYAFNADGDEGHLGPNTDLLIKPVTIDAFLAKVHAMLEAPWGAGGSVLEPIGR